MSKAIEIAMFRLAEGVPSSQLVEASSALADWLQKQPGYINRSMSQLEDDSWIDIVHWESMEASKDAGKLFMAELGDSDFMRRIDPDSVTMLRGNIEVES